MKKRVPPKPKPLSWKPRRGRSPGGETYCSPACGGGCTLENYQEKLREAKAIAEALGAHCWAPRVWENLGWFAEAVHDGGHARVQRRSPGDYVAYISKTRNEPFCDFKGHGTAADEALREARKQLSTACLEISAVLLSVPSSPWSLAEALKRDAAYVRKEKRSKKS